MAESISTLNIENLVTAAIQTHWPQVHICLQAEFGSLHSAHRVHIREALAAVMGDRSLLDLACSPLSPSVSISHCPSLGGFAYVKGRSGTIGFDVEDEARLQSAVIARVSTPAELAACRGHEGDLWVAKEALWKALRPHQPYAMTQIQTHTWQPLGSVGTPKTLASLRRFKATLFDTPQPLEGSGLVIQIGSWRVGIYLKGVENDAQSADRSSAQ
jgi:hypothetical protein